VRHRSHHIGFGKPGISKGVIWASLNRLLEIVDALAERIFVSLIPEVAAFEIKFIGLRINRLYAM